GCESQPGARFGLARRIDALAGGCARVVRRTCAVHFTDGANDLGVDVEVRSGNCEPVPCHLPLAGWRGSILLAAPRLVAVVLLLERPMADQPASLGLHGGRWISGSGLWGGGVGCGRKKLGGKNVKERTFAEAR